MARRILMGLMGMIHRIRIALASICWVVLRSGRIYIVMRLSRSESKERQCRVCSAHDNDEGEQGEELWKCGIVVNCEKSRNRSGRWLHFAHHALPADDIDETVYDLGYRFRSHSSPSHDGRIFGRTLLP